VQNVLATWWCAWDALCDPQETIRNRIHNELIKELVILTHQIDQNGYENGSIGETCSQEMPPENFSPQRERERELERNFCSLPFSPGLDVSFLCSIPT
jgi:hypothetical protein